MARIESSDIDALIDISEILCNLRDLNVLASEKNKFEALHQRVRKVYILLLNASEKGQMKLQQLCTIGIPDNSRTAAAIRTLCPDLGTN